MTDVLTLEKDEDLVSDHLVPSAPKYKIPSPPIDDTPIIINGVKIDPTIKNQIKGNTEPVSIYKRNFIPKKIRRKPIKIDLKQTIDTVVDNTISRGSEIGIQLTKEKTNKEDIKRRFTLSIDQSVEPNPIDLPKLEDLSPKLEDLSESENVLKMDSPPEPNKVNKSKKIKRTIRKIRKKVSPNKNNESEIPEYDKMSAEDALIYRNTFRLKFDTLRKIYPALNITPGIEDHPSLYVVHKIYELYLTQIYKEINSNMYRGFLLLSWLGLEMFGTYVLGLDATGYCKQQIELLWAYEPLINELSQVNFSSITEGWSPFQKLIGLIFGTFVFMIVIKLVLSFIGKKTGIQLDGLTSMVMSFISNMVVSKPDAKNIPPIIIQQTPTASPNSDINLGNLHNIPIPQPSSLGANSQINLINTALNLHNAYVNRNNPSATTNTTSNVPSAPIQNIVNPIRRAVRPPIYTS